MQEVERRGTLRRRSSGSTWLVESVKSSWYSAFTDDIVDGTCIRSPYMLLPTSRFVLVQSSLPAAAAPSHSSSAADKGRRAVHYDPLDTALPSRSGFVPVDTREP